MIALYLVRKGYVVEILEGSQQQEQYEQTSEFAVATTVDSLQDDQGDELEEAWRGKYIQREDAQGVQKVQEPGEVTLGKAERRTTANIPIVRTNTPRLSAYSAPNGSKVTSTTFYETEGIPPFPTKPPSAPPVPEADARFDVIEKSRLPAAIYPVQEEVTRQAPTASRRQEVLREHKHIESRAVVGERDTPYLEMEALREPVKTTRRSYRLIVFATYILILLCIVLVFAIMQGVGVLNDVLTVGMLLLGVPWMVLTYGLLGGCVSCLVTLGRYRPVDPPGFVIVTWYARPFAAVVLSLCAYLLLNSGLLLSVGGGERHQELAFLVGMGAGLCEGWLFLRKKERM